MKTVTIGLAALFALLALLSGARVLLIEAAVPPRVWLDDFRNLAPGASQQPLLSDRNAGYLAALVRDASFVYAWCDDNRKRASVAGDMQDATANHRHCLAAIDHALAASPASAELWLERARLITLIDNAKDEAFHSLRQSYRLAPSEGWLMVRRIAFLAPIWPLLPEDLQTRGRAELDAVLSSWFIAQDLGRIFLGDPGVRLNMIELIEASSDPNAKARLRDALHSLASEGGSTLPSAEVAVVAGGEAWQGPPAFRLWADDVMVAEVEVRAAIDTARVHAITPQMISSAMKTYFITVPNIETVKSIAIEFFNDAWAGEGNRGDRNLWIREISLNGKRYAASVFVPETSTPEWASIVDGLASLAAVGRFRIDRPAAGWPMTR